jgi:putative oxidoreductase
MDRWLGRWSEQIYALARIFIGFAFALHGVQKLFGGWGKEAITFSGHEQHYVGGVIELACGLLIAVGLFTSWAAFLASGTMAVAYFQFHVGKSGKLLPIENGGDAAWVYCFIFLYMAAKGDGPLSLGRAFRRTSTSA